MSRPYRILNYGIQGFRRNIWLSLIAIVTMTLTIVTISVFIVGNVVATQKYQEVNGKLDLNIFIRDAASQADVEQFRTEVESRPEVAQLDYISKDDALKRFNADPLLSAEDRQSITAENNPLPREIDVRFKDPNTIDAFNGFVSGEKYVPLIDKTSYQNNRGAINNYLKLITFLRVFGISFTVLFLLIAILVILNTIRLTIFSRRDEIEVMRLVGATASFIRGPFLVEGILFGLIGALLAALLAWLFFFEVQRVLNLGLGSGSSIASTFTSSLSYLTDQGRFNQLFGQLVLLQLVIGISLGTACSAIAVRRYLRE